jgi:hypothetical protein
MKKFLLIFVVLAFVAGSAFADFNILSFPTPVEGGDIMIDLGLGLRGITSGGKWVVPPIFASVEYALPVGVPISVGGMFAFYQYKYDWYGYYGGWYHYKWTDMVFAVRANWHWGLDVKWLDLYTGLSLGYTVSLASGGGSNYSGFYYAFQGGAHFYFTKVVGAVAEVGYPFWIKAGLALKF